MRKYCRKVQGRQEGIAWASRDGEKLLHGSSRMARKYFAWMSTDGEKVLRECSEMVRRYTHCELEALMHKTLLHFAFQP